MDDQTVNDELLRQYVMVPRRSVSGRGGSGHARLRAFSGLRDRDWPGLERRSTGCLTDIVSVVAKRDEGDRSEA
jgi:hypothetical protein